MIRQLEEKDINQVMSIWLETNIRAHDFIEEKYWNDNFENVKKEIINAEVYVYEENKHIQGFVGIIEGYIAGIFVKENMQRNGIGKLLIDRCKQKYEELTLRVYEKNESAISFYKKQNFYIENKEVDKQTKETELIMKWIK